MFITERNDEHEEAIHWRTDHSDHERIVSRLGDQGAVPRVRHTKKLLAEAMLGTEALKAAWVASADCREQARGRALRSETAISERRVCSIIGLCRATQRYEPCYSVENDRLIERIRNITLEHLRFGYRRDRQHPRREGSNRINNKRHC